jgi:hypothetical protein
MIPSSASTVPPVAATTGEVDVTGLVFYDHGRPRLPPVFVYMRREFAKGRAITDGSR